MLELDGRMAQLRARFLTRLNRDRVEIAEALASGDHERVRHIAHQIAGIAGSFGEAALGDVAYELEQAIENDPAAVQERWRRLETLSEKAGQAAGRNPS